MPKVTITYDTSEPDDDRRAKIAIHSEDITFAIDDYLNWLRDEIRYKERAGRDVEILQESRDKLINFLEAWGVTNLIFD